MEDQHLKKWRIRDIIDLEYFFHKDSVSQSGEDQQYLHERDRNIFLSSLKPSRKEGERPERQFIVQSWLNWRRKEEAANADLLPGESFESLYRTCRILFILAGLCIGGGSGLSFLTYTGDRPLNVFVYLSVFIFSQILLLLLLLVLSLYRLKTRSLLSSSPLYRIISRVLLKILLAARKGLAEKMGADRRSRMEAILGVIGTKARTYGFLLFLPVFILTQLFGVGFNLGLLATTLFKVITADIAFGWQSTLQLSPAAVHSLVQKIALPWSWLAPGAAAYPSLEQIEGSRIILKEGIYHLSTPDLASWWPFLCFSVLFYGLLPRLLLFLGAAATLGRHLRALDLSHGIYEQLLIRMTTPLVSTRGRRIDEAGPGAPEPGLGAAEIELNAADKGVGRGLLVMIPDEIFASCSREEITSAVQDRFAATVTELVRINENNETDARMLKNLHSNSSAETDILIIQEAWQPPILEYLHFIKDLRRAIGPGPCIRIGLIGKPQANTIFTPVKEENRKIWTRKISAMGDPCIFAVGLINHAT
jgi:hypothetical protein